MTKNIDSYQKLIERYKRTVLSPPDSETLRKIIEYHITPEEADFLVRLSYSPSTLRKISKRVGVPVEELMEILDKFAEKGLVFRKKGDTPNKNLYRLSDLIFIFYRMPWWAGKDDDYHRKLAPLVNQYYIDNMAGELTGYHTQGLRSVPVNQTVEDPRTIIPYEDIVKLMDEMEYYSVSHCACRQRHNLDSAFEESKYPLHVCFHFNDLGRYCDDIGVGTNVTREEVLEMLKKCADAGLVHGLSNQISEADTLCNCDPDYCLFLEPIVKMPGIIPRGHQHSNYIREIDEEKCIKCGLCAKKCPIGAIEFIKEEKKLIFTPERCLGCGVCAHLCPKEAITMKKRDEEVDTPKNIMDLGMRLIKERGIDITTWTRNDPAK